MPGGGWCGGGRCWRRWTLISGSKGQLFSADSGTKAGGIRISTSYFYPVLAAGSRGSMAGSRVWDHTAWKGAVGRAHHPGQGLPGCHEALSVL